MSEDMETLFIECDHDAVASVADEISRAGGVQPHISERTNLDGMATASTAVFVVLALKALPHVLNFLLELIKIRRVRSIRIGETEVQNPGPEELRVMLKAIEQRIGKKK